MPDFLSDIWAAVPVKAFGSAKSRLSTALPAHLREGLARAMLVDVLAALRGATRIRHSVVITADREVAEVARSMGADVLHDQRCAGQTAAGADVDALCALLPLPRGLVLAPAGNDGGTNAVLCAPPSCMRFHFGGDSYSHHLRAACELGLEPVISDAAGFRLDIDRPADLEAFLAAGSSTRAHAFLREQSMMHVSGGILGTMA